jgi:hypothetical protein
MTTVSEKLEILQAIQSSPFGEIAPRISGSISAISSALIIVAIFRSSTRLSSPYHRIMFGMSVTDILGSIAIALTHLPMPREGISAAVDSYGYHGLRLGNTMTCSAQGFVYIYGLTGMCAYNAVLCVYFACAIALEMSAERIRRIERMLHFGAHSLALGYALLPLSLGSINPSFAWCAISKFTSLRLWRFIIYYH